MFAAQLPVQDIPCMPAIVTIADQIMKCFLVLILVGIASPLCAQLPAILTDDANTLGSGVLELGAGAEYLVKSSSPEPDAPYKLKRLGRISAHFGVSSNVDFSLDWRGGLVGTYAGGREDSDWGDLTITTKIRIVGADTVAFSMALRSSVKLPNTSRLPHKLGSDATDYFLQALASLVTNDIELRSAAGFGIIGNPEAKNSQDDIYTFGGAVVVPISSTFRPFVELTGFVSSLKANNKWALRSGIATQFLGISINMYGSARIAGSSRDYGTAFELSEDWGIGIAFMHVFRF